ncbi:hypothetical protein [Listeria marthii]|uniref:hypothetical protein n=1 Tax=Listeria marthii TaxID=529731 RepID=UPI0016288D84|nr:hypothetical protein [Listeria marthii]MBC2012709.1 hypothetical protein [Listeria marthii]MBF2349752.1 hypothetical protein [Listeria marthii]MBF2589199.1 hypothetical protein [Listeria marthii]MBF2627651.1 hypothetical protein [Listeria marthii]UHP09965.1 hypothetical protein LAX80_012625 [Listeria marthii]
MTQYHYLASKSLLGKGNDEDEKKTCYVYKNDLDFLSLNFEDNIDYDTKEMFSFSKHFNPKCKFQVAISEGKLPLKNEYQGDAYEIKSLSILYDYILNASQESDTLELYTSWNGEEDLPLTDKKEISIEELTPESLILRDRELIIIKNKNIYNF